MASFSTNQFKPGLKIMIDGAPHNIIENEMVKPGKGQAFNRVKVRNLLTGRVVERTFKSGDSAEGADVVDMEMQYLYNDGDGYHFMDTTNFEQVQLQADLLGDTVGFLLPDMNVEVEFYGENPIGIEIPQLVDLKVIETTPGIKGATATNQLKPAKLETGVVVQVPPFINEGDVIRVNTETGEYQTRA